MVSRKSSRALTRGLHHHQQGQRFDVGCAESGESRGYRGARGVGGRTEPATFGQDPSTRCR